LTNLGGLGDEEKKSYTIHTRSCNGEEGGEEEEEEEESHALILVT
jgi:hypothetical protein